nr:MAG TPA: hypothetical protein [Bacteriophage sp.]
MRPNRIGAILYELLNFIVCGYVRESLKSHQVKIFHSLPGSLFKGIRTSKTSCQIFDTTILSLFQPNNSRIFTAKLPQNYRFSQTSTAPRYCQAKASKALSNNS